MPPLASEPRRQLENVCTEARELAEAAARSALQKRAVDAAEPFAHFTAQDRDLRTRLRARGRQVGDVRRANKTQSIDQLTQELAYEYWHRMLFARFLAENNLLMHPDGVPVSLADCDELAKAEGAPNGFVLAARYASRMLPQIFRTDDVLLEIEFPVNDRLPLEKQLASLPTSTFTADDSLGWVYQFWQAKKKKQVNESGEKIDGRTLPAVTQLFTEHYMVQFLLHNTIGAWWCMRHGIQGPPGGAGVPAGKAPVEMEYLRWRDDGTPAAGKFEGWPKILQEFTMLDPCCGSGHFLVAAFNLMVPLRMHDEGLSARDACNAVLRENLFGLELDPRCTQIAAFALALAAWKYPGEDGQPLGHRPLPPLHIACSGQSVTGKKEEWLALAGGDSRLRTGMEKLYDLFQQAPHLGSLIDPRHEAGDMFTAEFHELRPLLERALAKEATRGDADAAAVGVAAKGIVTAYEILSHKHTLIATNVPYLASGRMADTTCAFNLKGWTATEYREGKADLATAFILRTITACQFQGVSALVTPQNWMFLASYKALRERLLKHASLNLIAPLGPGAFATISGEVVKATLLVVSQLAPIERMRLSAIEASVAKAYGEKAKLLKTGMIQVSDQADHLSNPDARLLLSPQDKSTRLEHYASSYWGQGTGDYARFTRYFWEVKPRDGVWDFLQSSVSHPIQFGGREQVVMWENGRGQLAAFAKSLRMIENHSGIRPTRGSDAWGKTGVAVSLTGDLPCTVYTGEIFDANCAALIPRNPSDFTAIWTYCSSEEFHKDVRVLDRKMNVMNGTLLKVPIDLDRWRAVAAEQYPNGLPEPHSDDPNQWLFRGDISSSTNPLQVAVARLLGYRWPDQPSNADHVDKLADKDGIVCIPAVRGQLRAVERLLEVLYAAYGSSWSGALLDKFLTDSGCKAGVTLDDWLRNQFFEQHCKHFHQRPFIWHIWDARKDGFSCLVNYHKLNHKALENLTYSHLQDWITTQSNDARENKTGADLRLKAAQDLQDKLKLILAGEPPHDIFVRWKPLAEQPIGWNPDLNDSVRLNIRPFVVAGVLRKTPNVKWTKDRGNEPERDKAAFPWFWDGDRFTGDRVNDVHLTNVQKRAVRR
jgi:hypothetical protein